jgi:hypothetical protein
MTFEYVDNDKLSKAITLLKEIYQNRKEILNVDSFEDPFEGTAAIHVTIQIGNARGNYDPEDEVFGYHVTLTNAILGEQYNKNFNTVENFLRQVEIWHEKEFSIESE